jgi:hypothetical protein
MPGEYMQAMPLWQTANKACYHQTLGGTLCGPDHTSSRPRTRHKLTLCASQWSTQQLAGLKLQSCWYHSYLSLIFSWVQSGNWAKAHISNRNNLLWQSSATVCNLINRTWFSHYPWSQYIIYNNWSEFNLHFKTLCDSYSLKCKPSSVKNHKWMQYSSGCIK